MLDQPRFKAWIWVIIWASVIFFLSSVSNPQIYLIEQKFPPDWFIHGVEYGFLGILLAKALKFDVRGGCLALMTVTVFLGLLYGFADEVHQYFVPGRTPDLKDFLTDAAALLIASWIVGCGKFERYI